MLYSNFYYMLITIAGFLLANVLFIVALAYYRRANGAIFVKVPFVVRRYVLQTHFIKLCVMFAALYFTVFVVYNYTGISCDTLDRDAQCQCYGLEVASRKPIKEKLHWAENGRKMCPDSKFFANFIEKNK